MNGRAQRRFLAGAVLVLFLVGLGVFVAPFAFPTPRPIVTGFQATRLFSPTGDGTRDIARVAVKLNERSMVSVEITDRSGRTLRRLVDDVRPKGRVRLSWDGTDESSEPVSDGSYVVRLRARAGRKQWNASKAITVDRQAPSLGTLSVRSATLGEAGPGECRVAATALERGDLSVQVSPLRRAPAVATFAHRGVKRGETVLWEWDGDEAGGTPAAVGFYIVVATLRDTSGNRSTSRATCFVGRLAGETIPAGPNRGDLVRLRLRRISGEALPASTPVEVTIQRRLGTPGVTGGDVIGVRVGAKVRGPVGQVRVQLPRRIRAASLWLLVKSQGARALIPLDR